MALLGPALFRAGAADPLVWAHYSLRQHLPKALLGPINFAQGGANALALAHCNLKLLLLPMRWDGAVAI